MAVAPDSHFANLARVFIATLSALNSLVEVRFVFLRRGREYERELDEFLTSVVTALFTAIFSFPKE